MRFRPLFSAASVSFSCLACFSPAHAQPQALPPNTSANPATPGFSNGTLPGNANVSGVNVHTLLYPGNTTKVLVHYLPWMNNDTQHGINVHYKNSDPAYIKGFLKDLQRRGVDGVMIDWQGQSDISDTGSLALQPLIHGVNSAQGQPMTFAIMLDANLLGRTDGSTNQAKVLSALQYVNAHYLKDPSYLTYNGKPVVGDFALTASSDIDWAAIQKAYPNIQFVHLDNATSPDGFGIPRSAGSFLWISPTRQDVSPPDMSDMDRFYSRSNQHPGQIAMGAAYKGFNSQYAPWDGQAYTDQVCGQTWLNSFAKVNQYFNSGKQLPFLQLVTWDDYYEGTPLETGIDNCLSPQVSVVGKTLKISYQGPGSPDTLQELKLWSRRNGAWGSVSYPANAKSIPAPRAGTYFVEFEGKPFFRNWLSQQIKVD